MKKYLFVLVSFCSTFAFGQHYQTIFSNRIGYYANTSGNIRCIKIDSVKHETDSILYLFSNIQNSGFDCFTPFGASWMGEKVIIQKNGYNILFNLYNDSIHIKTNAGLNDIWTVCRLPDSIAITATVLEHDTMGFLGLDDSVKTIGFGAYDKNMNPVSLGLNNKQLLLSKNHGFIKTFNFYLFPDFEAEGFPYEQVEEYDLIGLSNPIAGVQNLLWMEVHDFQKGDELHVLREFSDWGTGYDYYLTEKSIFKYLERADYPDSTVYIYSKKHNTQESGTAGSSGNFSYDTLKTTIIPDPLFDLLPGTPIISEDEAYAFMMTNGDPISKTEPSYAERIWPSDDSCWFNCCADGCFPSNTFVKGLGGPYYHCTNAFSGGGDERKLVYYKKGQATWGTPLVFTGDLADNQDDEINVFPNPAKDFVKIQICESKSRIVFELFDLNGCIVLSKFIDKHEYRMDLSDLNPGVYIYRIKDSYSLLKIGKLIIN
ncbi:MAG: T9SS type A sorting domain-containing protein [Bacteroidota bacterium]